MSKRRVVVTGLGLISPTGNDVRSGWQNVRDGVSGISVIDSFDTIAFHSQQITRTHLRSWCTSIK